MKQLYKITAVPYEEGIVQSHFVPELLDFFIRRVDTQHHSRWVAGCNADQNLDYQRYSQEHGNHHQQTLSYVLQHTRNRPPFFNDLSFDVRISPNLTLCSALGGASDHIRLRSLKLTLPHL